MSERPTQNELNEALFLIYYDDRDMKPEILIGESAARTRFAQVSVSWNAHLFGKVESNSKDSTFYTANYNPSRAQEMEEVEVLRLAVEWGLLPDGELPTEPVEKFVDYQDLVESLREFASSLRAKDAAEIASLKAQLAEARNPTIFRLVEKEK